MYSFRNDYSEGAHPNILKALIETNEQQEPGYGEDQYTKAAIEQIKKVIQSENCDIHLLPGGTHTNLIAISSFLRPHEAVISATTGHINTHEAGSIEATGHKVLAVETNEGKLTTDHLQAVLAAHPNEHMVKPKLVFISNSTELGTIYTKAELQALHTFCQEHHLLLYVDGARLGSALCSKENDIKITDLPNYCDAFYIGGTKNGALIGEALVICNDALKADFRYLLKQKGALLAKGRLLGIQFFELFKDDLYFKLAAHANRMAERLHEGLEKLGVQFLSEAPTNQIFPILPNEIIHELERSYEFEVWEKVDSQLTAIRLVTSWATNVVYVDQFIEELNKLLK